ncbi:MAG: RsmE family RNA methyltransferase [Vulcanimicrobiaceae bacterium]
MPPRMPRFFVEGAHAPGDRLILEGGDARKLVVVLRAALGDPVEIVDSHGVAFVAKLRSAGPRVSVEVVARIAGEPAGDHPPQIIVAQAVPKARKMDFVVEKLTELGVTRIIPFLSERSVARAGGTEKPARWRRLAVAAAAQCGRLDLPLVDEVMTFEAMLVELSRVDVALLAWELAAPVPLRDVLPGLVGAARSILVAIGPEGGFSYDEVERAGVAGAHAVSLGRRILRTETAPVALMSVLAYLVG